jgi:hypothetical protein
VSRRVPQVLARLSLALALSLTLGVASVAADTPLPSGEVTVGQTVIEPAYDLATGTLVYLSTPMHAVAHPNTHNVAPIYLPMYPVGAAVGTLNCEDVPVENCPDHGPLVAGIAEAAVPLVYGAGVQGHDHLVGIASTGGDFNVLWIPILVLFNTPGAVTHVTTLSQLHTLEAAKAVTEIPLPPATFHCSVVSAAAYAQGTPFR